MSDISNRILKLIEEKGISYSELSRLTNIPKSALQRYATAVTEKIPLDRVEVIAKALNVPAADLMGWKITGNYETNEQKEKVMPSNATPALPATHFAPILGSVRAGVGGYAVQEIIGQNVLPPEFIDDGEEYFWLLVEGDSMSPNLLEGDSILVRAQRSVDNGTVAVVTVDDEEGVVKKVCYGTNWIELKSYNPYYPPRRFVGEDVLRICVMGKVVKSERNW